MWSNKYIGIPFSEKGRTEEGLDCWGLVRTIYNKELNINLPSLDSYENVKELEALSKIISNQTTSEQWGRIEVGKEKPFDVLVFSVRNLETHVGLAVAKGLMIHSERGSNSHHIEYKPSTTWGSRLRGIYRYVASSDLPPSI